MFNVCPSVTVRYPLPDAPLNESSISRGKSEVPFSFFVKVARVISLLNSSPVSFIDVLSIKITLYLLNEMELVLLIASVKDLK